MNTYFICHIGPIFNMTTVKTYRKLEPQSWFGGRVGIHKKNKWKTIGLGAFLSFFSTLYFFSSFCLKCLLCKPLIFKF